MNVNFNIFIYLYNFVSGHDSNSLEKHILNDKQNLYRIVLPLMAAANPRFQVLVLNLKY